MVKLEFIRFLSFFVVLVGILVVVSWIFDIGFLKGILSGLGLMMDFTSSLCFIASGIVLYSTIEENKESSFLVQAILPAVILLILLDEAIVFISYIFGFSGGLNNIFISEKAGTATHISISSMLNFILIAIAGIFTYVGFKKYFFYLGAVITFIGGVAILGYFINQPFLYYSIVGINTKMAFNAAILFVLIGIGFILCGKTTLKQN